jgi:uncharacterized protein (DUF433 family)
MERIVSNPGIFGGKPVIRGTRISVEFVLKLFASGLTEEQILIEYPHLTSEGIRAALDFENNNTCKV